MRALRAPVWLGLPVQEGMFALGLLCLTTLDQMLCLPAFESWPRGAEADAAQDAPRWPCRVT